MAERTAPPPIIEIGTGKRGPITDQLQKMFFGLFNGQTEDKWGWLEPVGDSPAAEKSA